MIRKSSALDPYVQGRFERRRLVFSRFDFCGHLWGDWDHHEHSSKEGLPRAEQGRFMNETNEQSGLSTVQNQALADRAKVLEELSSRHKILSDRFGTMTLAASFGSLLACPAARWSPCLLAATSRFGRSLCRWFRWPWLAAGWLFLVSV
jgi:hypothetical protein